MNIILEADGGSRGNPGPAGYGAVLWNEDHTTVLSQVNGYIGLATNNVAEYHGLIAGLEEAHRLNICKITIRMDSKLVIEQMLGRWKVKHPGLIPLHHQASQLTHHFRSTEFIWIPRKNNTYADRLVNEAIDAAQAPFS